MKCKDIPEKLEWVKECLEHRDHMTIFRLDSKDSAKDIDVAILQALLKVNKDDKKNQVIPRLICLYLTSIFL